MKKAILPLGLSGLIVAVDQLIKVLVSSRFPLYDTKVLIPHILEFFYLHNDGAAMGMFSGGRWPLIVLTAVVLIGCVAYLLSGKCTSRLLVLAFSLIIGGGIGNLIDRIYLGYVIDYVRFPISWFAYSFNIADCAVCIGAALLVLDLVLDIFHLKKGKQRA